jgi:hypothetical protein
VALQGTWKAADNSGYTFTADEHEVFNTSGTVTQKYKTVAWTQVTSAELGTTYLIERVWIYGNVGMVALTSYHIGSGGKLTFINTTTEYTKQ